MIAQLVQQLRILFDHLAGEVVHRAMAGQGRGGEGVVKIAQAIKDLKGDRFRREEKSASMDKLFYEFVL